MADIINSYDQCYAAGGECIFISFAKRHSVIGARWIVHRIVNGKEMVTDPDAAWYDHKRKVFDVSHSADRKPQLVAAMAWAAERFGPREFVRNRIGDYVEKEVNKQFPIPKQPK